MSNLFSAHEQMSNIYRGGILKIFPKILNKEIEFEEEIFVNIENRIFCIKSVYVENGFVFARGSWKCCPSTSCNLPEKKYESVCLEKFYMEDLIRLSKAILILI